jgi:hypothetical protein
VPAPLLALYELMAALLTLSRKSICRCLAFVWHSGNLAGVVLVIVLHNAKAVNPDIAESEPIHDSDRIL